MLQLELLKPFDTVKESRVCLITLKKEKQSVAYSIRMYLFLFVIKPVNIAIILYKCYQRCIASILSLLLIARAV